MSPSALYPRVVAFLAGAAAMIVEVLGGRLLAPWFGSGVAVWSAVISVVLLFLAIGYRLGGTIATDRGALAAVPGLAGGAGLLVALVPVHCGRVLDLSAPFDLRLGALLASVTLFGGPMLLLGALVPAVVRCTSAQAASAGEAAGKVYALSTAGSVVGTLLAGFVVFPYAGLRAGMLGTGGLLLLAGLAGAASLRRRHAVPLLLAGAAVLLLEASSRRSLSPGPPPGHVLTYERQSPHGLVQVLESPEKRHLLIDRIPHGSDWKEPRPPGFALIEARFPLELLPFLRPSGKDALVLGLGAAVVPKMLDRHGIRSISVELDEAVAQAARSRFGWVGVVAIDDARRFLARDEGGHDFLVLDCYASDRVPFHLVTIEAFRLMRSKLAADGILAINFIGRPGTGPSGATAIVLDALSAVFSNVLWFPTEKPERVQVMAIFASDGPLEPDRARIEAVLGPAALGKIETLLEGGRAHRGGPNGPTDDRSPLEVVSGPEMREWRRKCLRALEGEGRARPPGSPSPTGSGPAASASPPTPSG